MSLTSELDLRVRDLKRPVASVRDQRLKPNKRVVTSMSELLAVFALIRREHGPGCTNGTE